MGKLCPKSINNLKTKVMINNTSESVSKTNDNMNEILSQICLGFTNELEKNLSQPPIGCCYLFGHCLAIGLENAGFIAKEVTGQLILTDKHDKKVVYGNDKSKGKLVGYYHTWCVLEYDEKKIIIDPSLKYNKIGLRKVFGIKLNQNIPDTLISHENKSWLCTYIEDERYIKSSKQNLNKINPKLIEHLVKHITKMAVILYNKTT